MSDRKLNNWIEAFKRYTENTEPAELFREWTAVSVIASALRRKCRLEWGSLTFYPNMYIVLVGPSGSRKGTAMDPGLDIMREIPDISCSAEATTREALIRQLERANSTDINIHTGEQQHHSSLTIWSQELTVFLGYHNRQLMSDLCDWFDCRNQWVYETKTQGTDKIIGVWVHIFGATTPALIQTSIPRDAIGGGLTSRMIMVFEPTKGKIVSYPEMTSEQVSLRHQLVLDLGHINIMSGVFKYTEKFMEKWIDWYNYQSTIPPFNDHNFHGYFERRPTHIMKLAMIQSAARKDCIQQGEMVLTGDDLERAINLLERTEVKMPNVFLGVGKSDLAEILPRMIAELTVARKMHSSELMALFYRDLSVMEFWDLVGRLQATTALEIIQLDDNSKSFVFHPERLDNIIATKGKLLDGNSVQFLNGVEEVKDGTTTGEGSTGTAEE